MLLHIWTYILVQPSKKLNAMQNKSIFAEEVKILNYNLKTFKYTENIN